MSSKKRCFWCNRILDAKRGAKGSLSSTKDHFPARVNKKDVDNLPTTFVLACLECNNARGNDDRWVPFVFRTEVQQKAIFEIGTAEVIRLQSDFPDSPKSYVLNPKVYEFIIDVERLGMGYFGSDLENFPE